jgi:poly-gamma-glutamate capsule biosynthesis protein CapA/YwtB (metallophosphatase superfamily)
MKKRLVFVSIGVILIGAGAAGFAMHTRNTTPVASAPKSATKPVSKADPHANRIRLIAAGDFIAHDSINQEAKQSNGSYDYLPMMSNFTNIFHSADIRFCNDANLNGGSAYGLAGYPKFNSPTEFARDMGRVGCNMVNVGTNHSFDRNQDAINASIAAWDAVPNTLAVVGHNRNQAEHDTVHYFTSKGVKFAFLAYTTYLNTDAPAQNDYGVNVYSNDFAARQVREAKAAGAQVIIASVRWGVEYSTTVSDSQRQVAQFLSDQGVNLILGHGSHILEPVQQLTGSGGTKTTVWYSLGNFLNTQLPAETLFNGIAVIDYDKTTKQITSMGFLPIYIHYEWTAAQAQAQDLLARHNIKMYLLDDTTQQLIDAQQLQTTVAAQRSRLTATLNTYLQIPLITAAQYTQ